MLSVLGYDYYMKNIAKEKKQMKGFGSIKPYVIETKTPEPIKDIDNLLGNFVKIPSGEFMMGSNGGQDNEKPVHKVIISKNFEIGATEVTQEQWVKVMGENPSAFRDGGSYPVENVSWDYVQQFLKRVNDSSKIYTYRLPTEAEWEYACRAGTKGDYAGKLAEIAWYGYDIDVHRSYLVAQKKPNAWGLYDMHGNVSEWCNDFYDTYPNQTVTDPVGPSTGRTKVIRGGGWDTHADFCKSSTRRDELSFVYNYSVGFRLVRVPR